MKLRIATEDDARALAAIYAPYVRDTSVTFEYEPPTEEEFARRIRQTLQRYPYLVAEEHGMIAGYAYAASLNTRPARCNTFCIASMSSTCMLASHAPIPPARHSTYVTAFIRRANSPNAVIKQEPGMILYGWKSGYTNSLTIHCLSFRFRL